MSKDFAIATNFNYFHVMYFVAIVSIKMKRIQFIQLTTLENSCLHEQKKNILQEIIEQSLKTSLRQSRIGFIDIFSSTPLSCA